RAVKQRSPEHSLSVKVSQVQPAHHPVFRKEEIETDEQPSWTRHPFDLAHRRFELRKIAEPITDKNTIERVIGKGEPTGVAAHSMSHATSPRQLQHAFRKIHSDGAGPGIALSNQ